MSEVDIFLRRSFPDHRMLEDAVRSLEAEGVFTLQDADKASEEDLRCWVPGVFASVLKVSNSGVLSVSKAHWELLVEVYGGRQPEFLWAASKSWQLVRPTNNHQRNSGLYFHYIGRAAAAKLYEKLLVLEGGQRLQLLGAKGCGKTTVVMAIAGYLIGSRKRQVVYVLASRFVDNPFSILLGALLVALDGVGDSLLLQQRTIEGLVEWCLQCPVGSLLFVVDDWDKLEDHGDKEQLLLKASDFHALVKLSSVNSRARRIWCQDDKADDEIATEEFEGPFNEEELQTWFANSSLSADELEGSRFLTGSIPSLLRFYEETAGKAAACTKKIHEMYTVKLYKFISKLTTREDLKGGMDLMLYGDVPRRLKDKLDFTCFYKDHEGKYQFLSPYLRSRAELYLMEQHQRLQSRLEYSDIQVWARAVMLDFDTDNSDVKNPARLGWNVEGLVIAVMRFRGNVFDKYHFKTVKNYVPGCELEVLRRITAEELLSGVLLVPESFNEKAVDVVFVEQEAEKLVVVGIQITVAKWKAKEKKRSHDVWKKDVLPKWKVPGCSQDSTFYYVMPESVTLDDVPRYTPSFKKFVDVDASLAEFDSLLQLQEPEKIVKLPLTKCSVKKGRPEARCDGCRNVRSCISASGWSSTTSNPFCSPWTL